MKVYALAILLALAVVEHASADWRNDVKINHWQHINSIINDSLASVQAAVNKKGASAQPCYESARVTLRGVSQSGYNEVSSCVRSASNAGDANVCSQKADSRVFNESLQATKDADQCIAAIK